MKRKALQLSILTMALCVAVTTAYAFQGEGREGDRPNRGGKGNRVEKQIMRTGHLLLRNSETMGLSEDQESQIKTLLSETKKSQIKQNAEIQLIQVDLKALMWEDTLDTAAINPLIDKKYELMKAKEKSGIQAQAQLKEILTEEQKSKLKEMRKQFRKNRKQGQGSGQGRGAGPGKGQRRGNPPPNE